MKTYIITELQVSDLRDALTHRVSDEEREGSIEILNGLPESNAEIERLRAVFREAMRIIKQGKAQFAPSTTNSDADVFIARYGDAQ